MNRFRQHVLCLAALALVGCDPVERHQATVIHQQPTVIIHHQPTAVHQPTVVVKQTKVYRVNTLPKTPQVTYQRQTVNLSKKSK